MRKLLILLCLIILTGCDKNKDNTLNCTLTKEVSGNTVIQNVVASFSNDRVFKVDIKHEMKLNDEYTEYIDTFRQQIDAQFDDFKNKQGITTNLNQTSNTIIFTISIDISEIDNEAKKVIGINVSGSYNNTKKSFENEGYTCK